MFSPARAPVTRIPLPPGFVFPAVVVSHGWFHLAPFEWSRGDQHLRRVEVLGGKPRALEIHADGEELQISGAPDTPELRRKLGRMLQLGVDLREFHRMAAASPAHRWVVSAGFGRLLCGTTLFEDVVKIIATTNTTWGQTVRMTGLLVAKCGAPASAGAYAFPSPEAIVKFSPEELQRDCRLGYRALSIHRLAKGIVEGSIDLRQIADPSQTTAALFSSYATLPGIGPYGAAHLLAMDGRHDVIAVDSEFRRFVRETYHAGRTVGDRTMLRRYARWGRWKYLAYWSELWGSVADRLQPGKTKDGGGQEDK